MPGRLDSEGGEEQNGHSACRTSASYPGAIGASPPPAVGCVIRGMPCGRCGGPSSEHWGAERGGGHESRSGSTRVRGSSMVVCSRCRQPSVQCLRRLDRADGGFLFGCFHMNGLLLVISTVLPTAYCIQLIYVWGQEHARDW